MNQRWLAAGAAPFAESANLWQRSGLIPASAVSPSPATIGVLLQRAVTLHQQGSLDAALALYRQVLARQPRQFDALHLAGVIARQQGDAATAVALIEQALAIEPRQARAHCNLGAAYADLGQSARALACHDTALALDPRYGLAHSNRGNALRQLGRLDDALASYDIALRLQPDAVDAACQRAIVFNDQGRHAQALAAAEQLLRLRPALADGWAAHGNALHGLGRSEAALESFARAGAIAGERADLAAWRGGAQLRLRRFEEALASFDVSLALRPGHPATTLRRAQALAALGRTDAAAAALQHALEIGADGVDGVDADHVRFSLAALGHGEAPAAAPPTYVAALFDQYADHFDEHLLEQLGYRTPQLIGAALARTGEDEGDCTGDNAGDNASDCAGDRAGDNAGTGAGRLDSVDLGCGTGLCGAVLRPLSASLTGVDLSAAMLERAHAGGLYDALACADITAYLAARRDAFDLIVAADVFVYVGDLAPVFAQARQALRPGGRLCFSVELTQTKDFVLQPSQRYAHSAAYVARLAAAHGFTVIDEVSATLRHDGGAAIAGSVVVLRG